MPPLLTPVAIPMEGMEARASGPSQLCPARPPEPRTQPFQLAQRPRDRQTQERIKQSMLTLWGVPGSWVPALVGP